MRIARKLFLAPGAVLIALVAWVAGPAGLVTSAGAAPRMALIPTAVEELQELRINTGEKAVLSDGTMNAVYVKRTPAAGNIFLNFHIDVASGGGSLVLHVNDLRLENNVLMEAAHETKAVDGKAVSRNLVASSYQPFDWFLDRGQQEVRGESLKINEKSIVQFTIEVPLEGRDDLVLFVMDQRIGSVRQIRARIADVGGTN